MFIDSCSIKTLRSSGAKCISTYSATSTLRSAGARTTVGREVYKHLALPEPEHLARSEQQLCHLPMFGLVLQIFESHSVL